MIQGEWRYDPRHMGVPMNKTVLLCALLAGCAGTPGPCPEGQARTNEGQCVAIAVPQQSLDDFDPFPQAKPPAGFVIDAPAKDEYVTAESQAAWAADNARRQQEWQAEWDNRQAEARADARTDRIVEAQRDTQRAVQELRDEVRQ